MHPITKQRTQSSPMNIQDTDDKWYFTGKPCVNGHIDFRLKSNRGCKTCLYERRKNYESSEGYTKWKQENRAEVQANYMKKHKGTINARTRAYQASKQNRTPKWLSDFDKLKIKCLYQLSVMYSEESGRKWHVDHVIPLNGKEVCGLHVPWNLQVIPASENVRKSNKIKE